MAVDAAPGDPRRHQRRPSKGAAGPPGQRVPATPTSRPFFLFFAAFSLYPRLDTAWVSLHDVRLSTYDQQTWIGLDNYSDLLTNEFFWNALRNTFTIGVISTVPQLCMALGLAHLLNYRLRGRTFFRVAMLMPYATSLAAATLVFAAALRPRLRHDQLGACSTCSSCRPIDWQNVNWPSQIAVSTIVIWRWTGYNALIYLAGMQAIDTSCTRPRRWTAPRAGSSSCTSPCPALRPDDPVHHRGLHDRRHPALR